MKSKYLSFLLTLAFFPAISQTARVQFVHNSADMQAEYIDIYLDGSLLLDNFHVHTASPFMDIIADQEFELAVADSGSIDASEGFASFSYSLAQDGKYLLVADGIVSVMGYSPAPPFEFHLYDGARETGSNTLSTDVLFCHGSTDAPIVDVLETELIMLPAFEDIAYGHFGDYLQLISADYIFSIANETATHTYATFSAPFGSIGLTGKPVTMLSSGFMNQADNSGSEAFGLWLALVEGGDLIPLMATQWNIDVSVQLIHNSADASTSLIDVYANGEMLVNDFAYHTATPYLSFDGGQDIEFAIAPASSMDVSEAIATFNYTLLSGRDYSIVANGITSVNGYNPSPTFSLDMYSGAHQQSTASAFDMLLMNGSTDAGSVDIQETSLLNFSLADDLNYGAFSAENDLAISDNYVIEITNESGSMVIGEYDFPAAALDLSGLGITMLTGGFKDPAQNSDGEPFGVWIALPTGGPLLPLSAVDPDPVFAQVQLIHNSADAIVDHIDVYVNGALLLNDFAFHDATPFTDIQVNNPVTFAIAPSNSIGVDDAIASFNLALQQDMKYVLIVNGIVSATGYNPAPALSLDMFTGARETALISTQTDINIFNGCTDCPALDINELLIPAPGLVNDFSYGDYSGYSSLGADVDYAMQVTNASGQFSFGEFSLLLNAMGMDGEAITIFSSGFLNPVNNNNGPGLSLWVAQADGATYQLPVYVAVEESELITSLQVYPNPSSNRLVISGKATRNENYILKIVNIEGQEVITQQLKNPGTAFGRELNVSTLGNGVYNLQLLSGQYSKSLRFIVMH